jgi:hypothetical protein
MPLLICLVLFSVFSFEVRGDWRKDPDAKKEFASSKDNTEKCKSEFSKHLQEVWAEQVEKLIEKYKKSGMTPKVALERAEKDNPSWTKENTRINDKAENFCSGQNWAVGCKVSFKKNSKSGAECVLTPIDEKTRSNKGKEKTYPQDFA